MYKVHSSRDCSVEYYAENFDLNLELCNQVQSVYCYAFYFEFE